MTERRFVIHCLCSLLLAILVPVFFLAPVLDRISIDGWRATSALAVALIATATSAVTRAPSRAGLAVLVGLVAGVIWTHDIFPDDTRTDVLSRAYFHSLLLTVDYVKTELAVWTLTGVAGAALAVRLVRPGRPSDPAAL